MSETAELLDQLEAYFRRFLILTDEQRAALCLWTAHTYVYDVADTTPYLIITSAEKRSGKTRVIETLQHVAHKPKTVTALTEAVLFRFVSTVKPTLLIDETDTIFRDSRNGPNERQEGLRAVLNAGYRRGTTIPRVMPDQTIREFECFCPKLLAGIGHLPDTIEDRGLRLRLTRKLASDEVERFRFREVANGTTHALREALAAWQPKAALALGGRYPDMPAELDDRAQDAYEILVAVADLAGGPWAERGRAALVSLRTGAPGEHESQGLRLMRDLTAILPRLEGERIPTTELLDWLYAEGEQPWQEWWGESTSKRAPRRLALVLGEYDVRPEKWWSEGVTIRGYRTEPIRAMLARYAPDTPHTPGTPDLQGESAFSTRQAAEDSWRVENGDLQGHSMSGVSDTPGVPLAGDSELKDVSQSRVEDLEW